MGSPRKANNCGPEHVREEAQRRGPGRAAVGPGRGGGVPQRHTDRPFEEGGCRGRVGRGDWRRTPRARTRGRRQPPQRRQRQADPDGLGRDGVGGAAAPAGQVRSAPRREVRAASAGVSTRRWSRCAPGAWRPARSRATSGRPTGWTCRRSRAGRRPAQSTMRPASGRCVGRRRLRDRLLARVCASNAEYDWPARDRRGPLRTAGRN